MVNTREIASEYRLSHWSRIMHERDASGLSIKAYCESINLAPNVFYYWQRKLREAACERLLPETRENSRVSEAAEGVIAATAPPCLLAPSGGAVCDTAPCSSGAAESVITIEIGKSRVSASADTDLELLERICRMLVSVC